MPITKTSWKKGQTGNPNGQPKREWTWAGVLEKAAEEVMKSKKGKGRYAVKELIAKALVRESVKGNINAIKEYMNRMDGLPKQDLGLNHKIEHIIITRDTDDSES